MDTTVVSVAVISSAVLEDDEDEEKDEDDKDMMVLLAGNFQVGEGGNPNQMEREGRGVAPPPTMFEWLVT